MSASPGLDFETYSEAGMVYREDARKWVSLAGPGATKKGLELVGMHVYAQHPSTEIISLSYDLQDGVGKRWWAPFCPPPVELFDYIARGGVLSAFNAGFEFAIWYWVAYRKLGWPMLPLEQLDCSAARARAYGLPGQLGRASAVIGVALKDSALGRKVINRYSIPRNPTKADPRLRIQPYDDAPQCRDLYQYNGDDVDAEASVTAYCPPLSPAQREAWLTSERINLRGIPIDLETVEHCIAVLEQVTQIFTQELQRLTNGAVGSASEIAKIQEWLRTRGVFIYSMDDEAVTTALKGLDRTTHPSEYRVLQIRSALASAGVKKLYSFKYQAGADGRVRGCYVWHQAHTGRYASHGTQTHNMKSGGPVLHKCPACACLYLRAAVTSTCPVYGCGAHADNATPMEWDAEVAEFCIKQFATRNAGWCLQLFGDQVLEVMAGCTRAFLQTPPQSEFICSDYTAIEGVGVACLAGEQWRIDVFKSHGKIYEMCASKITGTPFEEYVEYKKRTGQHHPHRKPYGKVPELASGYQGWIGAWKAFGADEFMTDDQIKTAILAWRDASPAIVELWGGQYRKDPESWSFAPELYGLEGAWIWAYLHPGRPATYRYITYTFDPARDVMVCRLPSGRCLHYHRPALTQVPARGHGGPSWSITYWTDNSNPKKGPPGWVRVETYGGSLTENVTQAVCYDIFQHGMINVERAGYPVVLHTHDELGAEVPTGAGSIEEFEGLMVTLPAWCADWPIKAAGGWRGRRYRKE